MLDKYSAFELLRDDGVLDLEEFDQFSAYWYPEWAEDAMEDVSRSRQSFTEDEFPVEDQINRINAISVLQEYMETAIGPTYLR